VEGKYHQVRRMTAAVGHPTLRLMRVRIGELRLEKVDGVQPGTWTELDEAGRAAVQAAAR
jgi:23S rRNA pseudouridine2457 synthase